jgi:radical SAM protein with 4Fe4S-binding SPASM domain
MAQNFTEIEKLPPKMQIGIFDGYCNLQCPMCFAHSSKRSIDLGNVRGKMSFQKFTTILDVVKGNGTVISPYRWSEPLMFKEFAKYAKAVKIRGLPLSINTNGILLSEALAEFFVNMQFDSITFSFDAVTESTFKKMRGIFGLEKIKQNVFMLLQKRRDLEYPRIGASFALCAQNQHEKEAFVSYWLQHVDVVRVNKVLDSTFTIERSNMLSTRKPCRFLYDSMVVDFKGNVVMCCLDALGKTNMGNVFKDGIENVWTAGKLSEVRRLHESGQYEKISMCRGCSNWANIDFEERVHGGILIRESPIMTFYNRLDRLQSWDRIAA